MRVSSLACVKGHKEDTILAWIREAARHAEAIEEVLMADYRLNRGQLDALWSYVSNKGEKGGLSRDRTEERGQFWRTMMIEIDTRLRVTRGLGKTETAATIRTMEAFQTLKRRGHPDLTLIMILMHLHRPSLLGWVRWYS